MDIKVLMADRARSAREATGSTQSQAAEALGVTRQALFTR